MSRREGWRKVLDSEVKRWTAMSFSELISELRDNPKAYQVEFESKHYNVEVDLLENAEHYLIVVAVDDGSLPASISPLCHSWILPKAPQTT